MTVILGKLDATPPAWAVRTWDWSASDPGEVAHEGQRIALTAPDGVAVAESNLSLTREAGYTADVTMIVSGGGFSSFPASRTPEFTQALRAWADQLDAEAAKIDAEAAKIDGGQ